MRPRRRTTLVVLAVAAAAAAAPSAGAAPSAVTVQVTADNGVGRSVAPGRSCAEGGEGAYWHYDWSAPLGPAPLSAALPMEATVHLDLHSDTQRYPNVESGYVAGAPTAFLAGVESKVALLNERGSVRLDLAAGDCSNPVLTFDGEQATGAGTWTVSGGSGAYALASGSGTFTLAAEVNPGADNPLDLKLAGSVDVPTPAMAVSVERAYWGNLGTDYLTRTVTVVYRVENVGTGDAYGATLTKAHHTENGLVSLGPVPQPLFDLRAGDATTVAVRYKLGLIGPCALVLLNCQFNTHIETVLPDAFDRPATHGANVQVKAPNLPPPL